MVSQEEKDRRRRQGMLAGFLAVAWWVASIGGIIFVISINAQNRGSAPSRHGRELRFRHRRRSHSLHRYHTSVVRLGA